MNLDSTIADYPSIVSAPGNHTIKNVKGPQETRFGLTIILTTADSKNKEGSIFVPFAKEISKNTNLARLITAFGQETDKWIGKKIRVTFDSDGKRRIEPVAK